MSEISFAEAAYPVRGDILAAQERAWQRLAGAGNWWTGADRLAIAAETRHAAACALCQTRKEALSPRQVAGEHQTLGQLPAAAIEAIHAIRTDPGRLTRDWYEDILAGGLSEEQYVELVAVVANVVVVDTFARGIAIAAPDLSSAVDGAPSGRRPVGAKHNDHWVPTLRPEDVAAGEPDPYSDNRAANIHRALSLVPEEVIGFFDLAGAHYLTGDQMMALGNEPRAIDRAQIELLASRVSALNQCVY